MGPSDYQTQIRDITDFEIPELLERLPVNGYYEDKFTEVGGKWEFRFTFASPAAHFIAHGSGATPAEAFMIAKHVLLRQVHEWHKVREFDLEYNSDVVENGTIENLPPVVMIVDDDVDTALATELMFKQLGCRTHVVCEPADMHRKISFEAPDLIILDWNLDRGLHGDDVVERAGRLIDAFSDLRARFGSAPPKVVTHSVVDMEQIEVPRSDYFLHLDHWQKPLKHEELVALGANALNACGF